MRRSPYLEEILQLDPLADHRRIVYLDVSYEFPFDMTRSLEFALFRTFAVPSIGALLDSTGEFYARPQKRYDDTDILVSSILQYGYDSERGRAALRRMNQIHGRFAISNEDFLYVLSSFVFEPIRWNERFGWRRMIEAERLAYFQCWREIGRRMNIKAIPEDYGDFERFNVAYERERFRCTHASRRLGPVTRDLFLGWFPWVPRRLGAPVIHALIDDELLDAFGFPHPSPRLRRTVHGAVRLRARALRLLPPRRKPKLRPELRQRSYPHGYRIEELGPPGSRRKRVRARPAAPPPS
jgi:ER-bound oxygenase mpaB/B'/Rubber oxygenase, catalytic domain